MGGSSGRRDAGAVVFTDRWGGARVSREEGVQERRTATVHMRHLGPLDWAQDPGHDGDQIWPLREDGLPAWFPAEAPVLRNSAVLVRFPDGELHLRAMSGAGGRAVQLLAQWGHSLVVDSYADVTVDTGVPITRYREISFAESMRTHEVSELGRLLRLSGVVVHAYAGTSRDGTLRFRRVGGVSAFPELRVLHRTAFDGGAGHHYFGHPRQLRLLLRLLDGDVPYEAVPDEEGALGSLVLLDPAGAVSVEARYQEECGGLMVADSCTRGGGPDGPGDPAVVQRAA